MVQTIPILPALLLALAPLVEGAPASPESTSSHGEPSQADTEAKLSPLFDIKVKKPKDRIVIHGDAKSVRFDVTSPSGIGQMQIRRKADRWPKQITLRLHLKGLEQVTISNGPQTLAGSALSHGKHKRLLELKTDDKTTRVGQESPWFTPIEAFDARGKPIKNIPIERGYFQLRIPQAMLKETPARLTIRWIDFYRS